MTGLEDPAHSPTESASRKVDTGASRSDRDRGVAFVSTATGVVDVAVLEEISERVLWLAVRMVDFANHDRAAADGVKVGGHQASSASAVTVLTALYFAHLNPCDRVSVKPHASPVFHAIQYLLGNLDRSYLTTLRAKGGLQAYPSRTKDPDGVDFSTGSVGLGAVAPLFAAITRRYVDAHFGARPLSRFIALLGDAELDEGNVWEAVADQATEGLGNVMWIVDFNRQSLDRVVPGIRIAQWEGYFAAAGWHVVKVKYGSRLIEAFAKVGGAALETWIDAIPNEQYQSLFGLAPASLRARFLEGAQSDVRRFCDAYDDSALAELITDLGGHDLTSLIKAFIECDEQTARPSVVFAYTVKGWRLPNAGHPRNHSALITKDQVALLRDAAGLSTSTEWDSLDPRTSAGQWVAVRRKHLTRERRPARTPICVPDSTGQRSDKPISTQAAFGRILVELARNPEIAPYLVTTAPDVATSTNLAGIINKAGVFSPTARLSWSEDPVLKWTEGPSGQHIELGISEMNLFMLLGQLGLSWDLSDQPLLPIGTVYDPFVVRGLDAFIYSVYSGARFIVAGTPSGVTLAPEGGAHQSTITPSIGLELPNVTLLEPAYADALDWLVCAGLAHIAAGATSASDIEGAGSYYFRLSTRPIDQAPFKMARARLGDPILKRQVVAGAYRLIDARELAARGAPEVQFAASGAVLPEVLAAAEELADEGIAAHVVDVTSLDRLYKAWQHSQRQGIRTATTPSLPGVLRGSFVPQVPIVTAHDAASHAMAWLGSALAVPAASLGVDGFGQSGTVADLYDLHDLSCGTLVNAALAVIAIK